MTPGEWDAWQVKRVRDLREWLYGGFGPETFLTGAVFHGVDDVDVQAPAAKEVGKTSAPAPAEVKVAPTPGPAIPAPVRAEVAADVQRLTVKVAALAEENDDLRAVVAEIRARLNQLTRKAGSERPGDDFIPNY